MLGLVALVLAASPRPDDAASVAAARSVALFAQGLDRAANGIRERGLLFEKRKIDDLSPEDAAGIRTLWASLYDYAVALDGIKVAHREPFGGLSDRPERTRRFLVSYAALAAAYSGGLALVEKAAGNPLFEKLLDEADPERGLPPGGFARLKRNLLDPIELGGLLAGHTAYRKVKTRIGRPPTQSPDFAALVKIVDEEYAIAKAALLRRGLKLAAQNAIDVIHDQGFRAWFPLQRGVAAWMGDQRVRRAGRNLIASEQLEALRPRLLPADIVVERRNWYLSNIGLPGFWPHAEMYLGTPDELDAHFAKDPDLAAWLGAQTGRPATLTALLRTRMPEKFARYAAPAHEGEPHRVIEAVSEGVVFSTMTEAMLADYVGVMRPRLSKLDAARAIVRAFGHHGKAYDFDFDFATDSVLVCTELVYKSFLAPQAEGRSLRIPLVEVMGRRTLPANEWVKKFDRELGAAEQELDFVAFLDGRESLGAAVEETVDAFRRSHARVKWDIAQK